MNPYCGSVPPVLPDHMSDDSRSYLRESTISGLAANRLRNEAKALTDASLVREYLAVPMVQRLSIFADYLATEIIDRFIEEHAI